MRLCKALMVIARMQVYLKSGSAVISECMLQLGGALVHFLTSTLRPGMSIIVLEPVAVPNTLLCLPVTICFPFR